MNRFFRDRVLAGGNLERISRRGEVQVVGRASRLTRPQRAAFIFLCRSSLGATSSKVGALGGLLVALTSGSFDLPIASEAAGSFLATSADEPLDFSAVAFSPEPLLSVLVALWGLCTEPSAVVTGGNMAASVFEYDE